MWAGKEAQVFGYNIVKGQRVVGFLEENTFVFFKFGRLETSNLPIHP